MIDETKIKEKIERQKETGLSVTAFCANEGIAKSTYYYWRKKISRASTNRFIQLRVNSTQAPVGGSSRFSQEQQHDHYTAVDEFPMEISYPNGTTLRIKRTLDLAGLRSLVLLVD